METNAFMDRIKQNLTDFEIVRLLRPGTQGNPDLIPLSSPDAGIFADFVGEAKMYEAHKLDLERRKAELEDLGERGDAGEYERVVASIEETERTLENYRGEFVDLALVGIKEFHERDPKACETYILKYHPNIDLSTQVSSPNVPVNAGQSATRTRGPMTGFISGM